MSRNLQKAINELRAKMLAKAMAQETSSPNQVRTDDPNRPETEEDGIRAEALRRLRVRRASMGQPGQTLELSLLPNNTPQQTASTSDDKPDTPK
jgi:hypothetical protein